MQVYRVGNSGGESPLGKISRLLTGEGIDCDDLGDVRPENGCVQIDFTKGEDLVNETVATVPELPQILVASTMTLGGRQLAIADDFVSPDMPDAEIIQRVTSMTNAAIRVVEEVPEPDKTQVLVDGGTTEEDPLHSFAKVLDENGIEWAALKEESDPQGTGVIYTHFRRLSYARLLQGDYPGYYHVQMAPTQEVREEALSVGDFSYITSKISGEEVVARHARFLNVLSRLRNPDAVREDPLTERGLDVMFLGDRNIGNNLKNGFGDEIDLLTVASTAGAMAEAKKHDLVLIYLGGKDDAKQRLAFLQMLLKEEDKPGLALLFLKPAPDQLRAFCEKSNVTVIESKSPGTASRQKGLTRKCPQDRIVETELRSATKLEICGGEPVRGRVCKDIHVVDGIVRCLLERDDAVCTVSCCRAENKCVIFPNKRAVDLAWTLPLPTRGVRSAPRVNTFVGASAVGRVTRVESVLR